MSRTWSTLSVALWAASTTLVTVGCSDATTDPSPDAGAEGDAGKTSELPPGRLTEPLPKGEAIDTPDAEWTWVDFPKTRCMDDSPTGLGIKQRADSDKLLIVIQGGGACFNEFTCLASFNQSFGEADLAGNTDMGILNADDEDNPFRDWNMVFIPYCSGDIFSGSALDGTGFGGRTQAGYLNIRHYLTRLVPTFKDAKRVVLSGYSAGGFAASINWIQAIEGWGDDVRIDVLNDSGPPLGEDYLTPCLQQRLAEVWNWEPSIPKACEDCDIESGHVTEPVMRWSVGATKQYRHALISSTEDSVIKLFYAYGLNDCEDLDSLIASYPSGLYYEGLQDLQDNIFAEHPGARSFVVDSQSHVWTTQSPGEVESEGVVLRDWLEDFLDPKSAWQNVLP